MTLTQQIFRDAGPIDDRVRFSSKVPRGWRVWYSGERVIQICAGDRALFETGAWKTPPVRNLIVVVGPRFPGAGYLLTSTEPAGCA